MPSSAIAITLHLLASVVWVGGMFFAYMLLRPAAAELNTGERLGLWLRIFDRFFRWVWLSIAVLLATGFWMIFGTFGGMANVGLSVHLMLTIGIVMMLIYAHVYFSPYRRMKRAMAHGNNDEASRRLGQIRKLVAINLTLGLITIVIASSGRYL